MLDVGQSEPVVKGTGSLVPVVGLKGFAISGNYSKFQTVGIETFMHLHIGSQCSALNGIARATLCYFQLFLEFGQIRIDSIACKGIFRVSSLPVVHGYFFFLFQYFYRNQLTLVSCLCAKVPSGWCRIDQLICDLGDVFSVCVVRNVQQKLSVFLRKSLQTFSASCSYLVWFHLFWMFIVNRHTVVQNKQFYSGRLPFQPYFIYRIVHLFPISNLACQPGQSRLSTRLFSYC